MGNVVRIGDKVSCGDHSATGSSDVFANNLPITHEGRRTTVGHACFPPTIFITGFSSTVFVNNQPVALKDQTNIKPHRCSGTPHGGIAIEGSPDVYIEL
jgi:uncharacterized Zn-binding protein involved in type VI secretion